MNYEILDIETSKNLAKLERVYKHVVIRIYELQKDIYNNGESEIKKNAIDELIKIKEMIKK